MQPHKDIHKSAFFVHQVCKDLFILFDKDYMQAAFTLQVPPPEYIINKNIDKHVTPGETPEKQEDREHKSTFEPPYDDLDFLHQCIEEAIEPVTSGTENLSRFLVHSIDIKNQKDSWTFIFKHPGLHQFNQNYPGLGKIKLPGEKYYSQQEIIIIFWIHKFIKMYPCGMLFEADGTTPGGLLIPTWTEAVLQKRHENTKNPDKWYNAWDDWLDTCGYKRQLCTTLWYISKDNPQKDLEPRRAEWIKCLRFWTRFGQQFQQGGQEEEEEESSLEVGSEGTGESEGFSASGEESSSESVTSETHTSEYSDSM